MHLCYNSYLMYLNLVYRLNDGQYDKLTILSCISCLYTVECLNGCVALFRQPISPTAHYSDNPLLRRPIFPTMQDRTQSTNPWFNQVYPTGCSVGQANLDEPWPRQNVLERKGNFYPRLYIPVQGNYDRPTWYGES